MKKILSIIILWACCSFSYAQFPWGYVIGNAIGTTIRQQVINAQQREYQRQAQERERKRQAELEAQRERERKANEIHESAQYETGGYQWTRFYKGTSATVYGAKDKNGKELIPLSRNYTYIYFQPEEGAKGYFKVKKNDKYGACDLTGKEVVSCAYDGIMYFKGAFCYQGTDGEYHDLDVALDNEGKGCKPDPDRLVDKTKKTESDGYVWYATYNTGKKDDIYNRHGARSIDNRKIVPENYSLVYYLNGYFVAKKNDIDFNELYNANGVRVLEQNRQYCIAEIHADQGWAKVSRNAPSGKMVGAIDLRTSKEIVPMQASCMIRYNTSSKRFETKKEKETTWKKTTYSLDTQGVTISATQSSLSGTASSSSNSSNSTTTTSSSSSTSHTQSGTSTQQTTTSSSINKYEIYSEISKLYVTILRDKGVDISKLSAEYLGKKAEELIEQAESKEDAIFAFAYLFASAEKGYAPSQFMLAKAYLLEVGEEGYDEGIDWLAKAAEQGYKPAAEFYMLLISGLMEL